MAGPQKVYMHTMQHRNWMREQKSLAALRTKRLPGLSNFFTVVCLFGGGDNRPPSWLLPHFLDFIDLLDLYRVKLFPWARAPPSRLIWARDGICKFRDSLRPDLNGIPKEMKWLLNDQMDFSSHG